MLGACAGHEGPIPLAVSAVWTYSVRSGLTTRVEEVRVLCRVPVAGALGYEIRGAGASCLVAWSNGALVAARLGNTHFEPPIPILLGEGSRNVSWSGRMKCLGLSAPARGTLEQAAERSEASASPVQRATLTVRSGGSSIELTTRFSPLRGIVSQEQRTDGTLDADLKVLSDGRRG